MKRVMMAAMAVGLCASVVWAEEMIENPQYTSWAKFKPGTVLKMEMSSVMDMGGQQMVSKTTMTSTLKEVTADKAVLSVVSEIEAGGQKMAMPAQDQEVPAKIAKGSATTQPTGVNVTKTGEGDEEVTVDGKAYKCHWIEHKTTGDQFEGTSRVWTCPDVPGGTVKMTGDNTKPMKSKTTMQAVEIKPAS